MSNFCYKCGAGLAVQSGFCYTCGTSQPTTSTAAYSGAHAYQYSPTKVDGTTHVVTAAWAYAVACLADSAMSFSVMGDADPWFSAGFWLGALALCVLSWQVGCCKLWARTVLTVWFVVVSFFGIPGIFVMMTTAPALAGFELLMGVVRIVCLITWYTSPAKESFR